MQPTSEHLSTSKKRKRLSTGDEEDGSQSHKFSGGARKGVSSGLSTVVTRRGGLRSGGGEKTKWWKVLGGAGKGSIRLKTG